MTSIASMYYERDLKMNIDSQYQIKHSLKKLRYLDTDHELNKQLFIKNKLSSKILLELNAELREDIKYTIEERRNFYSFLLTAITIAIAPITILTGYFGMNFENMTELSADTYPSVPGVELLCVILTIFYGLLFVIAILSGLFYKLFC
jgi:Mg2+ and Co2+ transporter CorA